MEWRARHLRRPPRGMNVDGTYVMAAVATGIIASVIAPPPHPDAVKPLSYGKSPQPTENK